MWSYTVISYMVRACNMRRDIGILELELNNIQINPDLYSLASVQSSQKSHYCE